MRTKYFITPFGVSGTITPAVPNATDTDGFVSYNQGWTFDYQRDLTTDPLAKSPKYTDLNSIFNSITSSMQALQQQGAPEFITSSDNNGSAFSYGLGSLVLYSVAGTPPFHLYLSLVNANTDLPTVTASWLDLTAFHSFPYGPLNQNNTWSGTQTFSVAPVLNNNISLLAKDASGTTHNVINYTNGNVVLMTGGQNGFSLNNNANTQRNVGVDDSGNVAVRGGLTAAVGTGFSHAIAYGTAATFTVPETGVVEVEVWGAGGGSGGTLGTATASGPGCGGGYAHSILSGLTPGSTVAVTVGTGGSAGNQTPTNGGNGGSSSFGAFLSATGGQGGFGSSSGAVNSVQSPGIGVSGTIVNLGGDVGMCGFAVGAGAMFCAQGGAAPMGGVRVGGGISSVSAGNGPGKFPGGGAGGSVNQGNGSAGANGLVIVRY